MIVGGYDLDLYCDSKRDCENLHGKYEIEPSMCQFSGETRADAYRKAKKQGWKIGSGLCVCPLCAKVGVTPRKIASRLKKQPS